MSRYESGANRYGRAGMTEIAGADQPWRSCGSRLAATAKFCSECGQPLNQSPHAAEYNQVTVLFAELVIRQR